MRRLATFALMLLALSVSCVADPASRCEVVANADPVPSGAPVSRLVIHRSVAPERVGPIIAAAAEWSRASSGAFVFSVSYLDFPLDARPPAGEVWVYTEPKADKSSLTVGVCMTWAYDPKGRPQEAKVWIEEGLDPRLHYLVALHELGHALGLTHVEQARPPSIMFPYITDVGDSPTCVDRKRLCEAWGCEPGC